MQPENNEVNELLGKSLFKSQKFRDSLPFLKRVLDENPGNKEILFDMAVAMTECGMGDKALKVFMHLRPDPEFGAQSCLEAGKMHEAGRTHSLFRYLPLLLMQISLSSYYALCIRLNNME